MSIGIAKNEDWLNSKCFNSIVLYFVMEKSGKGVKVDVGDLITYTEFYKQREKCKYYHSRYAGVDEEVHCTQKYKKEYAEGNHKHCIRCNPADCIVPRILKNSMRNSADMVQYMISVRAIKTMEREKKVGEAVKIIEEAHKESVKVFGELSDILELNLDYSNPEVKKVLKLVK